jgi:hypothetical protein
MDENSDNKDGNCCHIYELLIFSTQIAQGGLETNTK